MTQSIIKRQYPNLIKGSFEDIFNVLWNQNIDDFFNSPVQSTKGSFPKVDIQEYPSKLEITATVPGLKKENLKIEITPDEAGTKYLVISGEKNQSSSESTGKVLRKEIHSSAFSRAFTLSEDLDENSIIANVKDGLLIVTINKKKIEPISKTKLIEIT